MARRVPPPPSGPDDPLASTKDAMLRLTEDLKKAARELTATQARFMVDNYYQVQQFRITAAGQEREATEAGEPAALLSWMTAISDRLEGTIRATLDTYTDGIAVARWAKGLAGIGPVLAAGLAAHIDITKAKTAGAIWRFAGIEPSAVWLGTEGAEALVRSDWDNKLTPEENLLQIATRLNRRPESLLRIAKDDETGRVTKKSVTAALAKRPWNARLKVLQWKIGESFVKVQNLEQDIYGKVYAQRKAEYIDKNTQGGYAETARKILQEKNFSRDTNAKAAYQAGRLPDGHIHAMAKRYAVKLFLSHYHEIAYRAHYGTRPPKPYVIEHGGHVHFIAPPNIPEDLLTPEERRVRGAGQ